MEKVKLLYYCHSIFRIKIPWLECLLLDVGHGVDGPDVAGVVLHRDFTVFAGHLVLAVFFVAEAKLAIQVSILYNCPISFIFYSFR